MSIKLITGTSDAPVAITTALRHVQALQQDVDMVWLYLQGAVEKIEDYLGRSLITKTFCLQTPAWPFVYCEEAVLGAEEAILLGRSPLISVDHVKYYLNGVLTTWSSSNYHVDTAHTPGRLVFASGVSFPTVDYRPDAIQIQFQAGYGTTPSSVPPALRVAVLELTRHWFDRRAPVISGTIVAEIPYTMRSILRAFRVESAQ